MKSLLNLLTVAGLIVTASVSLNEHVFGMQAEVPFEMEKGVIFINVTTPASERPLRFIFDTGAVLTTFEETTAVRLGLRTWGESGVSGLGHAPGRHVRGVAASCGGFALPKTAMSTNLINFSLSNHKWVDGLLGADFLQDKTVEIDFRTHRLHIETRTDISAGERLVGGIPFTARTNVIWVTVNSPDSKRPLTFLLDTGASASVLSLKTAKELGLALEKGRDVCVVGGMTPTWVAMNFKGDVKGRQFNSKMVAMDLDYTAWSFSHRMDGIVGLDFLTSKSVAMDFGVRQVAINGPIIAAHTMDKLDAGMICAVARPALLCHGF